MLRSNVHLGRKKRNFYSGGIYHIIQRGNNKSYIFNDHLDKIMFYEIIQKTKEKYSFTILYYVFMDNHYHLLLQMKEDNLSIIMKYINMLYSKMFNKKYNRVGTIFGQRFSSQIIDTTEYYKQVISYIAYNPVKANLVKKPSEYKWVAHTEIIKSINGIVDKNSLFKYLHNNKEEAKKIYFELILKDGAHNNEKKLNLEDIFKTTIKIPSLRKEILNMSMKKHAIEGRKEFIYIAYENEYTIESIANFLKYSTRAIRRIIKEK